MARGDSIAAAKAELYGLVSGANLPAGVTAAYRFEPTTGHMAKPVALTIFTVGMDPDFYLLALRIYQTAEVDAEDAQDNLDLVIQAVEAKLTSGFGRAPWTIEYSAELVAFIATCVLPAGREDWD